MSNNCISQDEVLNNQKEAFEAIIDAEKKTIPPISSEKADSEYRIKMKELELANPWVNRFLGKGDTLLTSIMGILCFVLLILLGISFCYDIERTKTIVPCITAVLGYLAGQKFKK